MTAIATTDSSEIVPAKTTFNFIQIFWVFVGASIIVSSFIAVYCITHGGNVAWSTRYGVWVQVACNYR